MSNPSTYKIYLINFQYYHNSVWGSIEDAKARAVQIGFETRIDEFTENGEIISRYVYSPITGFHPWP